MKKNFMPGTVVIIGRTNVGKSTLFNRLSETRKAMVSNIPGTTRDLKYAAAKWQGKEFKLVDTGGFLAEEKSEIKQLTRKESKEMKRQAKDDIGKQVEIRARLALDKSDLALLIVDGIDGLTPQDKKIADYLRQSDKIIILVVNKCDNLNIRQAAAEFYKLGLGKPFSVAAITGAGIGDLLDEINIRLKELKKIKEKKEKKALLRVAIIGKPNVGKSSLLNTLAKEEKAIVSPIPHTTREPNESVIDYQDKHILLFDTAGIRRKARIEDNSLEDMGVRMTIGVLKKADVALMMIDISNQLTQQDLQLGRQVAEAGAGVIIVANKYDLIKESGQENTGEEYIKFIRGAFPHLAFAPIVLSSAKTGSNAEKILQLVLEVEAAGKTKILANSLSKFLKQLIKKQPPARKRINVRGRVAIKRPFITKLQQIDTKPPVFSCEIDSGEELEENYKRYIINSLRQKFGFLGTPIRLVVRHNGNENTESTKAHKARKQGNTKYN
ncbi:ribosome biogenesis GTPase Der [Candidatus Kuenenbacteria bacterium RIFCSPLOWO2_12_FULL_42_13]|uniref:GTPase Der n=5 Tax=Candidatus Kueneniibacteriota TaxID=1752740 RepID=A0A0G1C1K6_9BACT|nr:MAG: GTPase Der [Candidatus Kuenenbacteria bacterium GW2011_GWA2_42_15]OGG89564.1 MAG: ribosome biogenesis GTPase Der [Candidatus Kuenenbacteria bacterium RIFCSPHIGHO2_02_FULL_42_29]OGG90810.1 MAG: ribosome biogenesis GTPase Der [Candidatus Kuenenbacteria bacterium RIFCSPLOWO2_02_FULL_42_16]OGG92034.1 MAG: ribosome biogenesis GTPase Der [Candidatus Kuenenbacteria bacterium RIFCSPLOWO2_12_FULL_42_13]OGG98770.1 MAG: ribosome biogenesis GTPase Der [Candidatus Kuenenbacteria bacterium RIFCSPHIGH